MTRPGDVIAQNFKRVLAHENAARVGDFLAQSPGISHGQTEMLGRVGVIQRGGFVEIFGDDNSALAGQRLGQDLGPWQDFHLAADFDLDGFGPFLRGQ